MRFERRDDWADALASHLEASRAKPFQYGLHDCSHFAAGAVEAMTGQDPIAEFRGKYNDLKTSLRALKAAGYVNLEAVLDAKFKVIPLARAGRGDLAFFDGSVGVVTGRFVWFVGGEDLERVPLRDCDKAWGVGGSIG